MNRSAPGCLVLLSALAAYADGAFSRDAMKSMLLNRNKDRPDGGSGAEVICGPYGPCKLVDGLPPPFLL